MKKCKSCQKEIDLKATKCPFCQTDQRNWFAKHKLLTGIFVLAFLIILITSASSKGGNSNSTQAASTTPATQPAIKVSSIQLANDYHANEVAADAKYKGNLLEVTGSVDSIGKDIMGNPYITLSNGSTNIGGLMDVQCSFSQNDESQLAKLSKGQQVAVQCTDGGMALGEVELQSCSLK